MMWGELLGVATVAVLAVIGVASIMLNYPLVFMLLKYLGGAYLIYLGVQLWRSRGKMAIKLDDEAKNINPWQLASQGFITAVANPKGWAFIVSLLPPFINPSLPMTPQLTVLVLIILCCEFGFLLIYASGGRTIGKLLAHAENVRLINRISGSLMAIVGLWLALG